MKHAEKVLQNCPSQRKVLFNVIGGIYSMDARLMEFDLDKTEPCLPHSMDFHVTVTVINFYIHRCISG